MTEAEDLTLNDEVQLIQYEDGDILLSTTEIYTWLTHPKDVEQLIGWLLVAYRYMLGQWAEIKDDIVIIHPEDIVFNSEEDEKAYYEALGAERKEE